MGNSLAKKSMSFQIIWQSISILVISLIIGLFVNYIRPDGIPLNGNRTSESQMVLPNGKSLVISIDDAKKYFESASAVFLDARSAKDYNNGHIKGAINLPWHEFDMYFDKVVPNLSEDKVIIAYCDGMACSLSKDLALALFDLGFSKVYVLVNGWTIWKSSGLPTEKDM